MSTKCLIALSQNMLTSNAEGGQISGGLNKAVK